MTVKYGVRTGPATPTRPPTRRRRLDDGLAHNLSSVTAKSVQGLLAAGVSPAELLRQAALFGARNRDGWGIGLTIFTALGNLLPLLSAEETYLALFHGLRRVAADCEDRPPRRDRAPLAPAPEVATLKRWLRHWGTARHRDGAERTLLGAIAAGTPQDALADLLLAAETDRVFADGGHSLDFINKAFECLDLIGFEHAAQVLPTVVGQMVAARGRDEATAWRQPVDLVALLERACAELPALFAAGRDKGPWRDHAALAQAVLGEDPTAIVAALKDAIGDGAAPHDLGRAVAYAAALRVARFGTANEFGDWETAHHSFTYCNAVHQALKRLARRRGGFLRRGGARRVPRRDDRLPRPLPQHPAGALAGRGQRPVRRPAARSGRDPLHALLEAFDRQQQVGAAARLVPRHLLLGHPPEDLLTTLAHALLREDAGFHAFQMLEAGVRQYEEWGATDQGRHVLIAVARYLAAHAPTERSAFQTADIAKRLMRGGRLHEGADEASA